MQDMYNNTENETSRWNVTCHYDVCEDGKEPASFMECMALFMLERKQGWDDAFRPLYVPGMEDNGNGGRL